MSSSSSCGVCVCASGRQSGLRFRRGRSIAAGLVAPPRPLAALQHPDGLELAAQRGGGGHRRHHRALLFLHGGGRLGRHQRCHQRQVLAPLLGSGGAHHCLGLKGARGRQGGTGGCGALASAAAGGRAGTAWLALPCLLLNPATPPTPTPPLRAGQGRATPRDAPAAACGPSCPPPSSPPSPWQAPLPSPWARGPPRPVQVVQGAKGGAVERSGAHIAAASTGRPWAALPVTLSSSSSGGGSSSSSNSRAHLLQLAAHHAPLRLGGGGHHHHHLCRVLCLRAFAGRRQGKGDGKGRGRAFAAAATRGRSGWQAGRMAAALQQQQQQQQHSSSSPGGSLSRVPAAACGALCPPLPRGRGPSQPCTRPSLRPAAGRQGDCRGGGSGRRRIARQPRMDGVEAGRAAALEGAPHHRAPGRHLQQHALQVVSSAKASAA